VTKEKRERMSKWASGPGVTITVMFIVLKLTGTVDWSWLWILSPAWLSVAVGVFLSALVAFMFTVATALGTTPKK
jgi:hypothetical protein